MVVLLFGATLLVFLTRGGVIHSCCLQQGCYQPGQLVSVHCSLRDLPNGDRDHQHYIVSKHMYQLVMQLASYMACFVNVLVYSQLFVYLASQIQFSSKLSRQKTFVIFVTLNGITNMKIQSQEARMNNRRHNFTKVLSQNVYFRKKSRKFFATKVWSYMVATW